MKSNHHGGRPTAALRRTLRRDALATRPPFSPAFHERLMERVACEAASKPEVEPARPPASPAAVPRVLVCVGGGLAALVLASWAVVWLAGRPQDRPGTSDVAAGVVPVAVAVLPSGDKRLVGIDTLPLYDDLDAGLRAGAWTLAESFVELPDWANLADFDAAALQSAASRP